MIDVPRDSMVLFSDIGCPWAHLAVYRWHQARERRAAHHVRLHHRSFPLELFNERATPKRILDAEIPAAGALDPGAGWQLWQREPHDWAVTMLPALESVHAAGRQGPEIAERLDRALRKAFFADSRNISLRHVILDVARAVDRLDLAALTTALDGGTARKSIFDDMARAESSEVEGSPHFFLSDGSDYHNPGIQHHWEGNHGKGFVVVDKDDPSVYEEMFDRVMPMTPA